MDRTHPAYLPPVCKCLTTNCRCRISKSFSYSSLLGPRWHSSLRTSPTQQLKPTNCYHLQLLLMTHRKGGATGRSQRWLKKLPPPPPPPQDPPTMFSTGHWQVTPTSEERSSTLIPWSLPHPTHPSSLGSGSASFDMVEQQCLR